jgi:ABC-type antimicrobial peptide transport system permease subunit
MARVVAERMWRARLTAALVAGFALAALLLAAAGVYTVTAYVMARRTREIGIRIALGASAAHVRRLAVGETLVPIAAGLAAGVVLAAALSRVMASLLYGVAPGDAWSFAAAAMVLVSVGAAAAWWPARRASRVAPVVALREE